MSLKRILGTLILIGYLGSTLLSSLGYVNRNTASAKEENENTSTQLVAVLVEDTIYSSIENDLKRYTTSYIQKKYPQSKALVLKINTKEYTAPEITKLLENLYFDGIQDKSSRLIGLVLVGEIPLPVVRYEDYIFPSIYPYVDFLEQKYIWDQGSSYFTKNNEQGQAEIWHGVINFEDKTSAYHQFFEKLKKYESDPGSFVDKKIWYDDFIALKKNFLEEIYKLYQNKLLFAEDLMYHRYTNLLVRFLQGDQQNDNLDLVQGLSEDLSSFGMDNNELRDSITQLQTNKGEYTPTKLLEKKLGSFLKDYHEVLSTPLLHTISENVKASDRREGSDSHYQKLHLKDQLLLGDTKTNGILKGVNDSLEQFVDKKLREEKYAMKTTVPIFYSAWKDKKKRFFLKNYYIPEYKDTFQFFYFGREAQSISNAQDFSLFRGSYRNLSELGNYSSILQDPYNPAKSQEEKTDLTKKGVGSSYDVFSTQVDANRGFNVLNTEAEYQLYQKEKKHAKVDRHCTRKWFGLPLKWKFIPCARVEWKPIGKCDPSSTKSKDQADCEDFQQFGNRVRGGATPLNIDHEKFQNQIYASAGNYDSKSAWKPIFDIAGSVPVKTAEWDANHFTAGKTYSSPTQTAWKEGEIKDATRHPLDLSKVRYFNVPLNGKIFAPESTTVFSLTKPKHHREDELLIYKYKVIPSEIKHDATTPLQVNGFSGLRYSENSESWGYYTMMKESLSFSEQDTGSSLLLQNLQSLNTQLTTLKSNFQSATSQDDPNTIQNLLPSSALQGVANLANGQAQRWSTFNDIITKNYAGDIGSSINGILLRQIKQNEKIGLLQSWYGELINQFGTLYNFLLKEQQIGHQIFDTFGVLVKTTNELEGIIAQEIADHPGTGDDEVIRNARESLYSPLTTLKGNIHQINQIQPCNANHSTLGSMLGKNKNLIIFGDEQSSACATDNEETGGEEESSSVSPFQMMINELQTSKNLFVSRFLADPNNPQEVIPGMNILTPERPIDSPRYVSFQGVGENVVKLIYPNLFKVELFNQSGNLLALKQSTCTAEKDEVRISLVNYLKNKVEEYNQILMKEKQQAKPITPHYTYLARIDNLATPRLEAAIRPYKPFTYEEMLEAIGGEAMLNTLAELLYYQSVSNQIKASYDDIAKDLQDTKATFDINEKIGYIVSNYLTQEKDVFFDTKKQALSKLIIPSYIKKGYEVGYINSDADDSVIPNQDQLFENFEKSLKSPEPAVPPQTPGDAQEAQSIKTECGFDINEALLLYNFQTKKFDWREGLKCWLKELEKKPFELKLYFEGSLGAVPLKESISGDLIAPLKDARETYKEEAKPAVAFHELPPYEEKNQDQAVQEILNQTQITLQNKKVNILNKTGSFNFLSLKDYGDLRVAIASTGDNCLMIEGQNTCKTKASITKSPFKNGFSIPFLLGDTTIGTVIASLELCSPAGKCGTKPLSISVVPGPVKSFEIGLPKEKKLLAGAYQLISLKAFDLYKNEILRTLEPYTIEVDKGNLIIGGHPRKTQEVNDFQNLTLLYRADPGSSGVAKFSVKDKAGNLLASNTATLIPGKLSLEKDHHPITNLDYTLSPESYFLTDAQGNMQINTKKAIPLQIKLKNTNNQLVPITTTIVLGAKQGLATLSTLKESFDTNKKKKLELIPVNSLFIEGGSATLYLIPGYVAGKETINAVVPGLPEQSLALNIIPGPLAHLKFTLEKEKIDPNTTTKGLLTLTDDRGNKLWDTTSISLEKVGPVELSPQGQVAVSKGELPLTLKGSDRSGLSKLLAKATVKGKPIQGTTNIITRKSFLEPAINSGLNIMYLNLFGSDRGNQRGYSSENKKIAEKIIEKSEKTLAITTQLVNLHNIKKTSLMLGKDAQIENTDTLSIQATQKNGKLLMGIEGIGKIQIKDAFGTIKVVFNDPENTKLSELLNKETGKAMFLYNLNPEFTYNKGVFSTKEGIVFGNLNQEIFFERSNEFQAGQSVWKVKGKGQFLGNAIFKNLDFSNSSAELENKKYEFGPLFSEGSTHQTIKGLFSTLQTLKSSYQGYDSIQNSDEMEKAIGFRGNFKNITSFAGGKTVGEATLPFGSEFLINIGDPLLKRIDKNQNLKDADYNQGLGKVVYSDPEKPIFKTLDIDYNADGLRDLLIVYRDGTIKLQKQYQDKQFQDMGTLMISAEQIKEVFIGDVDGNGYEDIILRNTREQLRIYTNEKGIFDVDGNIACLNTDVKLGEKTDRPESLADIHQLFLKDMDVDGKLDIISLDTKGYLKIFYGKGNKNNHSYLSKEVYSCDNERYKRQENSSKIIKKFGLQLNTKAIRDESLIRRDGLKYPTEEEISQSLQSKNNREKGIETDPILLGKVEHPDLIAPLYALDYSCERNEYGEQFCVKFWRYNTCKGASNPGRPIPACDGKYREKDRPNDDQRIRGKLSYEEGMCGVPAVPSCVFDGKEEEGRIDDTSKAEIVKANSSFDFVDTAQEGVGSFDKYVKNPFGEVKGFEKHEDWAFIPINKLETPSEKILGDKVRDISKRYTDVNGGNLENGDTVKVEVVIINKYAKFTEGSAFFDKIAGPWLIEQDETTQAPKNLKFHEGTATINPKTKEYAYYLTDLQFSSKNEIIYSYDIVYAMQDPLVKVSIQDLEIGDYNKLAPTDGMNEDGIPDFIIQPIDGCNKKQSLLFNDKRNSNRSYRESIVDLQALADDYAETIDKKQKKAEEEAKEGIKKTKSTETMSSMPGFDSIQEIFSDKSTREKLFDLGNGETINLEFMGGAVDLVEKQVQDVADKMCNGFSFGLKNIKACEGLPVPFNQAFLAPGKYHLMGCIPLEPLTRTLGKGLPVFHFPGTLYVPSPGGPIPIMIPWGLRGPGDGFLWANGGTYPSRIRIYVAPTLTAQLGLAICFGSYAQAKITFPPWLPLGEFAGNCIVTSMPLPCGKKGSGGGAEEITKEDSYHSWAGDYGKTNTCKMKKADSPFTIVASPMINDNFPTSLPEGSYLGGAINIEYDSITSEADSEQNGLVINGVKIQGVKDINNKLLGGTVQGIKKKLVGRFDRQTQYWINNLLRFRVEFIFPDMEHLSKQISTFRASEMQKLVDEKKGNEKEILENLSKKKELEGLVKNAKTSRLSKEQITALDLANGDNPFEKLKTFFNSKELVNISTQKLNVKIPWIYSEDIEAYIGYLNTWKETNWEVLNARLKMITAAGISCETDLNAMTGIQLIGKMDTRPEQIGPELNSKLKQAGTIFEEKWKQCKSLQDAKNQIMQMQSKFDKTSEQIFQNVQTLELYKRSPLEIYEWLHVSDRYLGELSALLSKFFGYINYWMEVNANRFSQYIDAIITILAVVKTYQVMVDLFVDRGKKCGKCTNDTYDQYSCKLSMLCPDFPIIAIPSVKIPSLYIDLSHLNLGLDIVLPRFNFVPESIELPRLPNFPEPPQLGANFTIDFNIPDIPQLPEPPTLPELPSFIPQVKMQLPILPPAPKIPELPNALTKAISIAKKLSKLFCIVKSGIGLVGESSVKARIEQMTQRNYEVPWVDNLNLTHIFKQTPLQGIDIQVDSYVNLQYNFDAFYSLMKGIVNNINQSTYQLTSLAQQGSDSLSEGSDKLTDEMNDLTDDSINLNLNIGYQKPLKSQLLQLQESLTTAQEKEKLTPLLALASTSPNIKKNENGISSIQKEIQTLVTTEQQDLTTLANLAKTDYTAFLKTLETSPTKEPIQLSFSTQLLEGNPEAEQAIAKKNPTEMLIQTESKRLDGYLLALKNNSAQSLNMTEEDYNKSKTYLEAVKAKVNQRNNIKTQNYAGTQTLLSKEGTAIKKTLLTQTQPGKPAVLESATTDLSSYVRGVLVKNRTKNLVNVVHSKMNYEQFPSYYQQDLNNDKKPEVITRDGNTVYVKYANDAESQSAQQSKTYSVLTPQLKNKAKKYEPLNNGFLSSTEQIKLYDENREVKNFRLGGQTFDSLSFSWRHDKNATIEGYLMRISERVDGLLEKSDLDKAKYVLFLPNRTEIDRLKLQIQGTTLSVKSQLGKLIYEVKYYNPANDTLQFSLQEVPRKWQYIQLTSLEKTEKVLLKPNAPRSNQLVAGRQVVGDAEPPRPKVELIRKKKPLVEDEGFDLEGFVGSYYDLQITRTDNAKVHIAKIEEEGKLIAEKDINAPKGTITIKDLFFTKAQVKNYQISAKDCQGNETIEQVSLEIKVPTITIEKVERFSGWKEGLENPVLISSRLETDIDKGDVSFERKRKGNLTPLSAVQKGQKVQIYPVSTYQTEVVGSYYDFGTLIGLYSVDNKLIATVNGENGEILIQPAYKKTVNLGVDFSKGYPLLKVMEGSKLLFEVLLQAESLIKREIHKGTLFPLEGSVYGIFNGGEVLMQGKETLLFIAPNGTLRTHKPLQGSYHFNAEEKTVSYTIKGNAFGAKLATITFKVKPI